MRACRNLVLLLLALLPAATSAVEIELRVLADTDTEAPGAVSDFSYFGPPALDGKVVVFEALAAGPGIWLWRGSSLVLLARVSTPQPGRLDSFRDFGTPSLAGDQIAFTSRSSLFRREGIYRVRRGEARLVVDVGSDPPQAGSFLGFQQLWLAKAGLVFVATTAGPEPSEAIFMERQGALQRIVDQRTPIPGEQDHFRVLRDPARIGERVFFRAKGDQVSGVYAWDDQGLSAIATTRTQLPSLEERFHDFEFVSARGDGLAFVGRNGERSGVYLARGEELVTVADTETSLPEDPDQRFEELLEACVDGGDVAFRGRTGVREGVYATLGGKLLRVVGSGDRVEGREVREVELGPQCRSGARIALRLAFDDAASAIALAELRN